MRIGIDARLIDEKEKFGIHIMQDHIINELAKIDKDNEYYLFFQSLKRKPDDFPGPRQYNFKKIVVRIPNGLGCNITDKLWADFFLRQQIKKLKIDVFHSLSYSYPTKKYGSKTVVTIHDLTHKFVASQKKTKRFFAQAAFVRSIHNADRIITMAHNTKNDILKFYPVDPERIHVIYGGLNNHITRLDASEVDNFKKQNSIPDDFILYVGYLLPHKNVERIVESYHILKKKHAINYKLVLVSGSGFLKERINNLIAHYELRNDILIKSYFSNKDLNCLYNAAGLFLFPSLYEGFGLPVLEAMAAGTPVITSNVSSLPEVAGGAAICVNPYDANEIADSIWEVISNKSLRDNLIKKGSERVKEFSWERNALETLRVYKGLVNND